jgi:leader peptidase (prepilin peptidase)/N-methyltransferase
VWAAVPFHFWSLVFFVFGSIVGSFLNVCIYRMPRGESVVSPPSHCPHCGYSIPWYLNVPLVTWVMLRGRCRNCAAPIAARYVLVELLTATLFLVSWLAFGPQSVWIALIYAGVLAMFVVATFIDLEHLIIPDEITIGGIVAGLVCSALVPSLHGASAPLEGLLASLVGLLLGVGVVYSIVRLGKLLFGRHELDLGEPTTLVFTEEDLVMPQETVPYEDLFYRESDTIVLQADRVEMVDRCYTEVPVRASKRVLQIGEDEYDPEPIEWMAVVTDRLTVPREAMGFGDVKFMGAIGAFLGWQAVLFSLMLSAFIGAAVGVTLIACGKREWSSRLPYGPYIALAALGWMFYGPAVVKWWLQLH